MTAQLMPVPLPASVEAALRDTLRKELEHMSFEELVSSMVDSVLEWEKQPTPLARRAARNMSVIHTRGELEEIMRRHTSRLLGPPGAAAGPPREGEIEGGQTDPVLALLALGVAVAVWLIGWAVTGRCDWYMGAASP